MATVVSNTEILVAFLICLAGVWIAWKLLKYAHKAFGSKYITGKNTGIMDINSWGRK